ILRLPNKKQGEYWQDIFSHPEEATEANAFLCLWECLAAIETQKELKEKLRPIQSTIIGSSYFVTQGHRTTGDVTIADWLAYYDETKHQTIFASAENPFGRLCDHMRDGVLTNFKKASLDVIIQRISNTTFYFTHSQLKKDPLNGVVL